MKNNFNQFIKHLQSMRLSRSAKRASWEYLVKELELKPATIWRWPIYTYAIFSLILTIALGTGISQAAAGAVPGDILYPVKTKVSEPVERLFVANTPATRANFEIKLVERRLDEAKQILQQKEQVADAVKDELKVRIAEQTARAISKDEEDNQQPELEAIFEEHKQIIKDLNLKSNKDVRKSEGKRHKESNEQD